MSKESRAQAKFERWEQTQRDSALMAKILPWILVFVCIALVEALMSEGGGPGILGAISILFHAFDGGVQ